jgi:hypothetical protein
MLWIINYLFSWWNSLFFQEDDSVKQMYLVDRDGNRKILTVEEMIKPHDHVEMEFVYNNKTYVHIMPLFHNIHKAPEILSAILNDHIDITDYVKKYLINDLTYIKVKYIIPQKYLSSFETLEILDKDCNSLIYRKLESRLEFLEPLNDSNLRERSNSCSNINF